MSSECLKMSKALKIRDLLVKTRGNQSEVARMLRINRGTLQTYMRRSEKQHIVTEQDGIYTIFVQPK